MKKLPRNNNPVLSIVIVSFNTKTILRDCLVSLKKVSAEVPLEVLVSDNGSTDGSVQMVKKEFNWVKCLENKTNLGFSRANNMAKPIVNGKYVLFLNSDTIVHKNTLRECIKYMDRHDDVASMTCKIMLPGGMLDRDTRRSFPTPFVAFTHFSGLDRLLPKSKTFARYWFSYMDEDVEHEVDVVQGAFHLSRKQVLDKVGWFDEDYFLDGEDIDLCWKIKKLGHKIVYYPKVSITHVKKASKKKQKSTFAVTSGIAAMELFYKKHLWGSYPFVVNYLVLIAIKKLLLFRLIKFYLVK